MLADEGDGTAQERRLDDLIVLHPRQHDRLHLRVTCPQMLEARKPVHPGHAQIEQHNIRVVPGRQWQNLLSASRGGHDLEVVLRLGKREPHRLDHQLVVVCN